MKKKVFCIILTVSMVFTLLSNFNIPVIASNSEAIQDVSTNTNTIAQKGAKKGYTFSHGVQFLMQTIRIVYNNKLFVHGISFKKNNSMQFHLDVINTKTGKLTRTKYSNIMNQDANVYNDTGFFEGLAAVAAVDAVKRPDGQKVTGYTYINSNLKEIRSPNKFIYATRFRNGLAGVRYYEDGQLYTAVIDKTGKTKFAMLGDLAIGIGNDYVRFSQGSKNYFFNFKGKKIDELTELEMTERNYPGYKESEKRHSFQNMGKNMKKTMWNM